MPHDLTQTPAVWGAEIADAAVAVLAVHGRGQSPSFMHDQSTRLHVTSARYYAPSAEDDSWYPLSFLEPIAGNQPALDSALEVIDATLAHVHRDGFEADRTVVWGFSQGACVLSQWLLTRPGGTTRALLCTGGFIGEQPPPMTASDSSRTVVMRSITHDPFVPASRVEVTAALLTQGGASVDLRIDPGSDHIITDEACEAGSRLIDGTDREWTGTDALPEG